MKPLETKLKVNFFPVSPARELLLRFGSYVNTYFSVFGIYMPNLEAYELIN